MKQTSISLKYGISIPRAIEISAALSKIKLTGLTASQMTLEIIEKLGITEENEIKAIEELVNNAVIHQKRN